MTYRRKHLTDNELAEAKAKAKSGIGWSLNWGLLPIALWAAGIALLCGLATFAVVVLSSGPPLSGPPAIPREEFSKTVVGKTMDEVKQAYGPPEKSGSYYLYYNWLSSDPATGRADKHVSVLFDETTGRCVQVKFSP